MKILDGSGLSRLWGRVKNRINTEMEKCIKTIELQRIVQITLPASGWSSSFPYTQTVSVSGLKDEDTPAMGMMIDSSANEAMVKKYIKNYGLLYHGVVSNGKVTIYARKKPSIDIRIGLKGR